MNSQDRRKYGRVKVNTECIVYVSHNVIHGVLVDISESGIGILFDDNVDMNLLSLGNHIQFRGYDTCQHHDGSTSGSVLSGDAYIARSAPCPLMIGCRLCNMSKNLDDYIQSKKVAEFA